MAMIHTPAERYQSTDLYRTLVSTKSIAATNKHEEFKFIPNHTKISDTWDARHLDRFINSEWGTKTPSIIESRGIYTPRGTEYANSTIKPSTVGGTRSRTSQLRMTSVPSEEKQKAYVTNSSKDFTIKEARNNTNTLVTNVKHNQVTLETHYDKSFPVLDKTFKPEKLEFSQQPNKFATPKERVEELKAVRNNQLEMQAWKEKQKIISKKHRVYKSEFQSGIIGLDNPLNDGTLIYKEQHDKIVRTKSKTESIEARRLSQLDNWTGTNTMVEFFNRHFEPRTAQPPRQIVNRNMKGLVKMEHTIKWANSGERLFAPVMQRHSPERANYLKSQENKGRNFDILSFEKVNYLSRPCSEQKMFS